MEHTRWTQLCRGKRGCLRGMVVLFALGAAGPVQAQAEPPLMTLEESIQYAIEHHPELQAANASIREASHLFHQRLAERRFSVGLTGSFLKQGPPLAGFTSRGSPIVPDQRYNASLGFRLPLFDGGLRSANQQAARADLAAEHLAYEQTRSDVALQVAVAYYNVLRAHALREVAETRLASAREQLRVAQARFRAGEAPRFDVVRAETEVRNAETDLLTARNGVQLAEAAFNNALGRDVETPVRLAPVAEAASVPAIAEEVALAVARERRPLLQEQHYRLEAGAHQVDAVRAGRKISIDWVAQYDRRTPTGISGFGFGWNIGVVAAFPFFDNGVTHHRVRQAEERLARSRAEHERDRQLVELQVRQSLLNLRNAAERVASAQAELTLAQEALRIAQVRYQGQVGIAVEITDAQHAVARAATNLANGKYDLLIALRALEYATGATLAELQARMAGREPVASAAPTTSGVAATAAAGAGGD